MVDRVLLMPEPEGGFTVTVPTLSGCITSVDECITNARGAIDVYVESLEADGKAIPTEERRS